MNEKFTMKEKVIEKYFNYNSLFYEKMGNLINKGTYFIDKKLIETQEKIYYINGIEVCEEEFFKNIQSEKCYFENHTYMSSGLTIYNKKYRNTLSLEDCIGIYKDTLDEVDLFILENVTNERFCHRDYEGNYIIPNKDWNV